MSPSSATITARRLAHADFSLRGCHPVRKSLYEMVR
jgi:hypothetical protein